MAAHFGREGDLALLQTRPPGKDELWRPRHTINITGHPNVPASTYAKVIVDTAVSLTGGRGQNPFFPTKAQIAIQTGFEVLRQMEAYVTIPNIHRLLLNEEDASAAIEALINKGDQRSLELVVALRDGFFGQPPEQLGGVQGTLSTYLEFFINPEIAEVFCANQPTFSMDQIDAGKIVCIAMPQKFQSERLYINTILNATETFGVKALAGHLAKKFRIPWVFFRIFRPGFEQAVKTIRRQESSGRVPPDRYSGVVHKAGYG